MAPLTLTPTIATFLTSQSLTTSPLMLAQTRDSQPTEFSTQETTISTRPQRNTLGMLMQFTEELQKASLSSTMPTMNYTETSMMVLSTSIVVDSQSLEMTEPSQSLADMEDSLDRPSMAILLDNHMDQGTTTTITSSMQVETFTENNDENLKIDGVEIPYPRMIK